MTETAIRDVEYAHGDDRLLGLVCAPAGAERLPAVVLIHDAFGLGDETIANARRIAELGFAVFAADVWGDRRTPGGDAEIGPLIGSMVTDRERWIARIALAHEIAAAQPEIDGEALVSLGYCFGGSSALEYARTGGRVRGVVGIHSGLDLIEFDWSAVAADRAPAVLICTGADDPMATPEQWGRLKAAMDGAGVDWELNLYSGTTHAFTSRRAAHSPRPELFLHHPRNAERAWRATARFLREVLGAPAANRTPNAGAAPGPERSDRDARPTDTLRTNSE
jgi:dienelactone hydrolase